MKLLWIIDPLEKLYTDRDSTLFFAHLCEKFGAESYFSYKLHLEKNHVLASAFKIDLSCNFDSYTGIVVKKICQSEAVGLDNFQKVFFRLEPPINERFIRQAQLASFSPGVINRSESLLTYSEKLLPSRLGVGIDTWFEIDSVPIAGVSKPVNSYAGHSVKRCERGMSLESGFVFQPFEEGIRQGEHRYFLLGSEIFGEVLRLAAPGEFRVNRACGGTFEFREADPKYLQMCRQLAPQLNELGIYIASIDFVGPKVLEINITCPCLGNFWYAHASKSERNRFEEAFRGMLK